MFQVKKCLNAFIADVRQQSKRESKEANNEYTTEYHN